ncbi:MAG: MiaB/RimO family radical SAM methylthiotransferase [Chitinispirillia bacterium]|jgi:threonylcarbamoyladenosine tRNA methylthiotransferase MtaB
MSKIAIKSFGCRTNQEEIQSLSFILKSQGHSIVNDLSRADIVIINTCSVTENTELKTKRYIKSVIKKITGIKVLITGCLAQREKENLLKIKGINWVVGNTWKEKIPSIILDENKKIVHGRIEKDDNNDAPVLKPSHIYTDEYRTRFLIKIQEGCDYSCSYCIVPVLRGPSRSIDRKFIMDMCQNALRHGYKEIVVTGTHIGQYSMTGNYGLVDLLKDMVCFRDKFRIRLSSLDPRDCKEDLFNLIINEKRICKHIHISVQSFSNEVLDRMNRSNSEYETFIKQLMIFKNRCKNAGIGGDFIVGFPGENRAMFEFTLKKIQQIGFNYGHVFRYSMRPGTKAVEMDKQVSETEKMNRSNILRKCLNDLRKKFIHGQLGTSIHTIITEDEFPVKGITSNYIKVKIPDFRGIKNTWQPVKLIKYYPKQNFCSAYIVENIKE